MRIVRVAEIRKKPKGGYTRKDGTRKESYDPILTVPASLLRYMGWENGQVVFMESVPTGSITMTHTDNMLTREEVVELAPFGWQNRNQAITESRIIVKKTMSGIPAKYKFTLDDFKELKGELENGKRSTRRLNELRKMHRIWYYFELQRQLTSNWEEKVIDVIFPGKDAKGKNKSKGMEKR